MRRMTTADFIAYTDLAFGEDEGQQKKPTVREATQADIDMLLG